MIPEDVLDFWFGGVDEDAAALEAGFRRWFMGGEAVDREVRKRFREPMEKALDGGFAEWEDSVRARLALIIVLDQFPRNVFRRTARAFAGDARALRLAKRTASNGEHRQLALVEQFFLLMPYQHAENRETQRESVRLFSELAASPAPQPVKKLLDSGLQYARKHCDIIARFGRFPYRNAVLGRGTTAEENRWLDESGERFGQ